MDAPPPQEDVGPYIAVSQLLRRLGFSAPEVFAEDRARGFLLIEDFGDDTYTRLLDRGADEPALYTLAVDTLVALQRAVEARGSPDLPPYDAERLLAEAALLVDWYAPAALGEPLSDARRDEYLDLWRTLLPHAALPGDTLVLRDYHVDNLMLLPDRSGVQGCGLLDFQDAVCGPPSYDLVSLLEDARRDVPADAAPADDRALSCCFSGARPARRSCARRPSWRLSATARSSASSRGCGSATASHAISSTSRGSGGCSKQELAHPALDPIARWLDRHLPRSARHICAR